MPNYEKPPIANNKENATDKLLPKQPHVKTLWMLRAFDRHGDEDNRGDNSDAMAFASQLEAALKTGPSSSVILIRDDLDDNSRSTGTTPTVVAFRPDATANEVRAILHRAIDITLGKYPSQDVLPPQVTDEALADKARRNLIQTWTVPGQQSTEPPTINKNIGPNSLISMKTFAIDGPELLPRGGTWALKHGLELAEVIGDNSREIFMLTRKDLTKGDQEVPFVVVVSQKASKEEAISAFRRAIEILEKPPEANPEPTKGWEFQNHGLASTEPARGAVSELAVGTIRGSKIKSGTKALEKIIERQAQRIEELAMQVGKLESINRDHFQTLDDVLKAAGANGISQVLSILVAVKAGKPIPEVSEMPEFPSRSTTFYMTKP